MPSFLKSEKNWAIDAISKKTSGPPLFSDILQFSIISDFFLGYFSIRGLLFQTISCHPHWNQRIYIFFKLPYPHYLQIFSANRGGGGSFFWNCINRLIFLWFQKRRHQIVRKSNPLIAIYKKIVSTTLGGGREPPSNTGK